VLLYPVWSVILTPHVMLMLPLNFGVNIDGGCVCRITFVISLLHFCMGKWELRKSMVCGNGDEIHGMAGC
jgi:hypothetical protein